MDKQYDNRSRRLGKGPKVEINTDLLKMTLKKYQIRKLDWIQYFWSRKFTSIHDRWEQEINRYLQRSHVPEWLTKGSTILIQKDPGKGTPKQLYTHNLPTEENIDSKNKGRDLPLANKPRVLQWGTEKMPQSIQRHNIITFHRSVHTKREQDYAEKSSYVRDYRMAYDMVLQNWIINGHKMYKILHEFVNLNDKTMKTWRV